MHFLSEALAIATTKLSKYSKSIWTHFQPILLYKLEEKKTKLYKRNYIYSLCIYIYMYSRIRIPG